MLQSARGRVDIRADVRYLLEVGLKAGNITAVYGVSMPRLALPPDE